MLTAIRALQSEDSRKILCAASSFTSPSTAPIIAPKNSAPFASVCALLHYSQRYTAVLLAKRYNSCMHSSASLTLFRPLRNIANPGDVRIWTLAISPFILWSPAATPTPWLEGILFSLQPMSSRNPRFALPSVCQPLQLTTPAGNDRVIAAW